jgi:hypothetical protein
MSRAVATLVFAALLALGVRPAAASSEKTVYWSADKIWPAAVRFIRIDARATITEKDADASYVLFELPDDNQLYPGALELITLEDDTGPRVRIVIRISDRPSYVEAALLEKLERKLRAELGSPPPRKPRTKKEPPADPPKEEERPAEDKSKAKGDPSSDEPPTRSAP